jgi:hypothetical protein
MDCVRAPLCYSGTIGRGAARLVPARLDALVVEKRAVGGAQVHDVRAHRPMHHTVVALLLRVTVLHIRPSRPRPSVFRDAMRPCCGHRSCVQRRKSCENRTKSDSGGRDELTPAQSFKHDCSPHRGLHVRRERVGVVPRPKAPVPNPNRRFATFSSGGGSPAAQRVASSTTDGPRAGQRSYGRAPAGSSSADGCTVGRLLALRS